MSVVLSKVYLWMLISLLLLLDLNLVLILLHLVFLLRIVYVLAVSLVRQQQVGVVLLYLFLISLIGMCYLVLLTKHFWVSDIVAIDSVGFRYLV